MIRTDTKQAELYLYNVETQMNSVIWQADRELSTTLLRQIDALLSDNSLTLQDISGIGFYHGPGSYTGLRIGATIANTLAYSLHVPIVGVGDDDWTTKAIELLQSKANDQLVLPVYGGEANVTL